MIQKLTELMTDFQQEFGYHHYCLAFLVVITPGFKQTPFFFFFFGHVAGHMTKTGVPPGGRGHRLNSLPQPPP